MASDRSFCERHNARIVGITLLSPDLSPASRTVVSLVGVFCDSQNGPRVAHCGGHVKRRALRSGV